MSDATALPIVNSVKDEIASLIADRDIKGNFFTLEVLANLVASSSTRFYAFPDYVLNHLVTIEAGFDSNLYYKLCLPDDFRRLGLGRTETNIVANYSNEYPKYQIEKRSVFLLSGTVIAVTNGLRIKYRKYPVDLANLTDSTDLTTDPSATTFGWPRQFHELIARKVSIEWKGSRPKPIPLSPLEQRWDTDLERQLSAIQNADLSDEILSSAPYDDGSSY